MLFYDFLGVCKKKSNLPNVFKYALFGMIFSWALRSIAHHRNTTRHAFFFSYLLCMVITTAFEVGVLLILPVLSIGTNTLASGK